jgi:hypothetical protein
MTHQVSSRTALYRTHFIAFWRTAHFTACLPACLPACLLACLPAFQGIVGLLTRNFPAIIHTRVGGADYAITENGIKR